MNKYHQKLRAKKKNYLKKIKKNKNPQKISK